MKAIFFTMLLFFGNAKAITRCNRVSRTQILNYLKDQSEKLKVDYRVALAMVKTESAMRACATNNRERGGAVSRGLFQIKDSTARAECNIKNPLSLYDYKLNIRCGLKYLKKQVTRFKGDYFKAVLAYNAGGYYLCRDRHIERGIKCIRGFPVNLNYATKVMSFI